MKKPKLEKRITFEECENAYRNAEVLYRQYLAQTGKEKFGTLNKASNYLLCSRGHLFDCIEGRRKLDSVRRLAVKLAISEKVVRENYGVLNGIE